jgi:predicted glycosyltransferase
VRGVATVKIWIDMVNIPHVHFFHPIIRNLSQYDYVLTYRARGETYELAKLLDLPGKNIGTDSRSTFRKVVNIQVRTIRMLAEVRSYDWILSLENAMSILNGVLKRKRSILFLDNDIKYRKIKSIFQRYENRIKNMSDHVVVPRSSLEEFSNYIDRSKLTGYDGYKEDIYLSEYRPDPDFLRKVPFEDFVVIRPETLGSLYVRKNRSLVPDLIKILRKENYNIIYLPREPEDYEFGRVEGVHMPEKVLNGLDLCHYSKAVLTGSGTMAREGAIMGRCSVSFYPGGDLLSVDRDLIDRGLMFHSLDPSEIVDHITRSTDSKMEESRERSIAARKELFGLISDMIGE